MAALKTAEAVSMEQLYEEFSASREEIQKPDRIPHNPPVKSGWQFSKTEGNPLKKLQNEKDAAQSELRNGDCCKRCCAKGLKDKRLHESVKSRTLYIYTIAFLL